MMKLHRVAMWTTVIFLAAIFCVVGLSKLYGASAARWSQRFSDWGYPVPVPYLVGTVEVVAGLSLLVPKWRRFAAATIIVLMIGAALTHLVHSELMRVVPPLVLGGIGFLIYSSRSGPLSQ